MGAGPLYQPVVGPNPSRLIVSSLDSAESRQGDLRFDPLLPDVHSFGAEIHFVRIAGKKPEQFFGNPTNGNLLCCYNRKAIAQVKPRLITKVRKCPHAGAVVML